MKKIAAICALLFVAAIAYVVRDGGSDNRSYLYAERLADVYYRAKDKLPFAWPNVSWETELPRNAGIDALALRRMEELLAQKKTRALLVIRHGKLVHEFVAPNRNVNERYFIAALGKSVTAGMAASLLLSDDMLRLDDPLSKFIIAWESDSVRRQISARHVLTHSSGIENVSFAAEHSGWKRRYLEKPDERYSLAINKAPLNFRPGSAYEYSGVAFYAFAYAIGRILQTSEYANVADLLNRRLMKPLGIPRNDWSISYGESAQIDGMELLAIGSGGQYSARAIARIGQLVLDGGTWRGQRLIAEPAVDLLTHYGQSPPSPDENSPSPPTALGMWINCNGFWPEMPRDMLIGAGGGHQILLIIPSYDLVLVRLGGPLGNDRWEGDYWNSLEPNLFAPLRDALGKTAPAPDAGC